VAGGGLAQRGEASQSVSITGVDLERYDRVVKLREKVVQGEARLAPGEAIIGSELASDLALRPGDRFTLLTGSVSETVRITALVDAKVMPSVNFEVATRSAVGPQWRSATPEQRSKLQVEFKTLLLRLYAGALTQLKDQTVEVTKMLPVQGSSQVVVQTEVRGQGEPIKLDYRLDKSAEAWKIIDVNVGGIWLVQNYRSQFAGELTKGGIDGLINALVERNKAAAK